MGSRSYHLPASADIAKAEEEDKTLSAIRRFCIYILPYLQAAKGTGTATSITNVLIGLYNHPDTEQVIANSMSLRKVIKERLEEFRADPRGTPPMKLLANTLYDKYSKYF